MKHRQKSKSWESAIQKPHKSGLTDKFEMKIIITGATGMVGEGILLECLQLPQVTEILSVSRKPCGINHPKLKEYLVSDFLSINLNDEKMKGYDACFFCSNQQCGYQRRRVSPDNLRHHAAFCQSLPSESQHVVYLCKRWRHRQQRKRPFGVGTNQGQNREWFDETAV